MNKLTRTQKKVWERLYENRRKASRLCKQLNRLNGERDELRNELLTAFSGEKEMQLGRHKTLTLELKTVEAHTVEAYTYPVFQEMEVVSD